MIILKKILNRISNDQNFTFVSIGSNDGIFVDEVFQSNLLNVNWNSYFIEPVEETFSKLIKNYSEHYPNNNFIYENYAIHTKDGEGFLITNKSDDSRGMCSFFRNENEDTEKIKVTKKTIKYFIEKNNISKVNFLKVDCEGMDGEIILQFFDNNIKPDLILFEDITLNFNKDDVRSVKDLIEQINMGDDYVIIEDTSEFQYEESNKLIIKKDLLKYV